MNKKRMNDSCSKEIKQKYWNDYSWIEQNQQINKIVADLVEEHLFEDLLTFLN